METLKWIIYVLIFATSTGLGILYSQKYQKRVNELKDFKTALNMLKTKIRFTYAPLKEIFYDISKSITSKTGKIFEEAADYMDKVGATDSWTSAVKSAELCVTKEDKEVICQFGKLLGKTDLDGQLNEIELSLNFLETQIQKAEEEKNKNAKLYKSLGVIAGAGIIIILI